MLEKKDEFSIDGDTKARISINSWIQVMVLVTSMIGLYFAMKGDISSAVQQGMKNAEEINQTKRDIITIQIQQGEIQMDLNRFRQQYERDMDKYIRDPKVR